MSEAVLASIGEAGGTVLMAGDGWRVVGLEAGAVGEIVGDRAHVEEVPASFEEAFVALSR